MVKAKAKAKAKSKPRSKAKSDRKAGASTQLTSIKMPKALKPKSLLTLINSDLGREIMADALIAAAGAAAAALTRSGSAKKAGATMVEAASSTASEAMQTAAGAVANVVADAARNLLPPSLAEGKKAGEKDAPPEGEEKPRYVQLASRNTSRKSSKRAAPASGKAARS
jgi:hypothetical protein